MSRTAWIVIAVIVVLAALAWAFGWITVPSQTSSSQPAAVAASGTSDAAIAASLTVTDKQLNTVATDIAAYGRAPSHASLEVAVTHMQVALTLLTQLSTNLKERAAPTNSTQIATSIVDLDQSLGTAQSNMLTVQSTLNANAKLDPLAAKLAGTQLSTALTSLLRAQTDAKASAQMVRQ